MMMLGGFDAPYVELSAGSTASEYAGVSWETNGTIAASYSQPTLISSTLPRWWNGAPPAGLYLRVTQTGGTGSLLGTLSGSWYALSSQRLSYIYAGSPGTRTATGTWDISTSADASGIVRSGTFSFTSIGA